MVKITRWLPGKLKSNTWPAWGKNMKHPTRLIPGNFKKWNKRPARYPGNHYPIHHYFSILSQLCSLCAKIWTWRIATLANSYIELSTFCWIMSEHLMTEAKKLWTSIILINWKKSSISKSQKNHWIWTSCWWTAKILWSMESRQASTRHIPISNMYFRCNFLMFFGYI